MPSQVTPKQTPTISNLIAILLIMYGVTFDAIQVLLTFIPGVGILFAMVLGWIALGGLDLWCFFIGGLSFKGKGSGIKMLTLFGSWGVEAVGIVDDLPGITAAAIGIIVSTRMQDRAKVLAAQPVQPAQVRYVANDNEAWPNEYQEAA